jgi:hypothetical protein
MATNKLKCRYCKKYGDREGMLKINGGNYCNIDCATSYGREKGLKARQKAFNNQTTKLKKAVKEKDVSWHLKEAQHWFNRFIRLRDSGKPCISCDKPDDGSHQRHASHYRSVGACGSMRFDESNVHASCSVCNNHLSGNIGEYTPRLISKIGREEYDRIKRAPNAQKRTVHELKEIISKYKAKCKELEDL